MALAAKTQRQTRGTERNRRATKRSSQADRDMRLRFFNLMWSLLKSPPASHR